jgi:transcriptional regulator with XRE-family HTH domain
MATMMASVEQREVLRCDFCSLVQFRTANDLCRRCHKCLEVELPVAEPAPLTLVPPQTEKKDGAIQVATAVRDLRHVRNLSQRQLAARMGVPRTYISKIENGKAMPTLGSLDRLARALKVDISALLRDANTRHSDAHRRPVPGRDRRLHLAAHRASALHLPQPRPRTGRR